jgi:hypothetical protein
MYRARPTLLQVKEGAAGNVVERLLEAVSSVSG